MSFDKQCLKRTRDRRRTAALLVVLIGCGSDGDTILQGGGGAELENSTTFSGTSIIANNPGTGAFGVTGCSPPRGRGGFSENNQVSGQCGVACLFNVVAPDSDGLKAGAEASAEAFFTPTEVAGLRDRFPDPPVLYLLGAPLNALTRMVFTTNDCVVDSSTMVGNKPVDMAIDHQNRLAYVANQLSDSVAVVNLDTLAVLQTISLAAGSRPAGIAVTPDDSEAWVVNSATNSVSVLDTTSRRLVATVPVGTGPNEIAVSTDGTLVWIPNSTSGTVTVIDTLTREVTATIPNVPNAYDIVFNRSGTRAYVTSATPASGRLFVIDTTTYQVLASPAVGREPLAVAVSLDGKEVYTANRADGTVSVMVAATNTVVGALRVGGRPNELLVYPTPPAP